MKISTKLITTLFAGLMLACNAIVASAAPVAEAPDALVKRISLDVIDTVKADKEIQSGNQKRVFELVESKILPFVDSQRMTSLAAGRFWREASPEQQKQLVTEFRNLLIYTYSGALSSIRDQKVDFKPLRASPGDTEVEVRSQVIQPRGEPIQLNYRMEKVGNGWKIYDINVLGAWLVETYKGNFAAEIGRSGIDGLIKALAEKNQKLASRPAARAK
jgi:phospholipid transport system substrate-binding protein